jgi:DNA integrity scanning protein DisA with diadenylate cyclase activity
LGQLDGASLFDGSGTLRALGAHLVPSRRAESAIDVLGGTRHTSARRFSHDHPTAVVVVVSEDGPVTVFEHGEVRASSSAGSSTDHGTTMEEP